jgi:hypothetical protein
VAYWSVFSGSLVPRGFAPVRPVVRSEQKMELWRPVGFREMALTFDSDMRAFPARLPEQPIFYPVLNPKYAIQIARDWNVKEAEGAGYVTSFSVPDSFDHKYERDVVGTSEHEEWCVPAGELQDFNIAIQGRIAVDAAFFSQSFEGLIPEQAILKGRNATQQFVTMANHLDYSSFDIWCETYVNRKPVYLHFLFWKQIDVSTVPVTQSQKVRLLEFIERRWEQSDIEFPLPATSL